MTRHGSVEEAGCSHNPSPSAQTERQSAKRPWARVDAGCTRRQGDQKPSGASEGIPREQETLPTTPNARAFLVSQLQESIAPPSSSTDAAVSPGVSFLGWNTGLAEPHARHAARSAASITLSNSVLTHHSPGRDGVGNKEEEGGAGQGRAQRWQDHVCHI